MKCLHSGRDADLITAATRHPTDSSFFYTCTQDFRVQMYDTTAASSQRVLRLDDRSGYARSSRYYTSFGTTQYTSLKPIKTIQGRLGNWTITDANLSPDNRWMIYSSITPIVHLVPTSAEAQGSSDTSDQQVALDFGAGDDGGGVRSRSGVSDSSAGNSQQLTVRRTPHISLSNRSGLFAFQETRGKSSRVLILATFTSSKLGRSLVVSRAP